MDFKKSFAVYFRPKMLAMLLLGFSSGLPVSLTASTLGVWLTEAHIDKTTIGIFAIVGTPYALKFLWSPLMDSVAIPGFGRLLGRRRGWLFATQLALVAGIMLMGLADPRAGAGLTALCALLVAFLSASQDIVLDAYRVEILAAEEQGAGAAVFVQGWRFGAIASGAGALYLASYTSWLATYWIMAVLMLVGIVTMLLTGEPAAERKVAPVQARRFSQWLRDAVIAPFADFMTREHWLAILLFILLYKFADAFIGVMTNPFYLDLGFTKENIASVVKVYGLAATIIGSFIGGWLVARAGAMNSLWVCGVGHAATNLMFVVQARAGADIHLLALGTTLENLTGGMGTTAFVAYLSGLTHVRFTATQYALLSSLAMAGRTWFSAPAGWFADTLGWQAFFLLSAALAIPGLAVLWWLSRRLKPEQNLLPS